jgi:hypothetical protein
VTTSQWPDHLLTLEDWVRLPEDSSRHYELAEGVLQVAPRPIPRHRVVMARLVAQLDAQLRRGLTAVADVEVVLEPAPPPTVRAPDVVVVPGPWSMMGGLDSRRTMCWSPSRSSRPARVGLIG